MAAWTIVFTICTIFFVFFSIIHGRLRLKANSVVSRLGAETMVAYMLTTWMKK